jgi:AraC-like DNA-binding protein
VVDRPTRIARREVDGSVWEMAGRAPAPSLRPHVCGLVGFDERARGPQSRRQFPGPNVVLIIEFGAPLRVTLGGDERTAARHAAGFAVGLCDRFATTEHQGRQRGIQVDLTPTGARRLFGLPLSKMAGHVMSLDDLLPTEHRTLSDRLDATTDWTSRLDLVEALLARRIRDATVDTRRIDWAVAQIESSGGRLEVGRLARELGYSRKHLISLFHDQVGVPPKLLARLVRFDRLMDRARRDASTRWADLAFESGYSDQAHLARDVRRFTGLTPTQARASPVEDLVG